MANNPPPLRVLAAFAGMLLSLLAFDATATPWYLQEPSTSGPRAVAGPPSTAPKRPPWPLDLAVVHHDGCPVRTPQTWPPVDPIHPFPVPTPTSPWVYVWPLDWGPCAHCTSLSGCTNGGPKPDVNAIPAGLRSAPWTSP